MASKCMMQNKKYTYNAISKYANLVFWRKSSNVDMDCKVENFVEIFYLACLFSFSTEQTQ